MQIKHREKENFNVLNKVIKCERKRGKIFANQGLEPQKDEIRCEERYLAKRPFKF